MEPNNKTGVFSRIEVRKPAGQGPGRDSLERLRDAWASHPGRPGLRDGRKLEGRAYTAAGDALKYFEAKASKFPFLRVLHDKVQATYQQIEKECSVMINKAFGPAEISFGLDSYVCRSRSSSKSSTSTL